MKRFFLFLFCVLALSGSAFPESSEVVDLFVGAFQNSGNNPAFFQTGGAEFELIRTNEGNKAMEKAREEVRARQEKEIRSTYASEPLEMNKQLKILQNQTEAAAKGTAKQRELLSILFSGTDNTFSKDSPEKCKRRVHSRQFLPTPDNSGQVKPFERQFIFTGVLNQKNSMLNVELIPKSQQANIVHAFHSQYEFQTFGRMWDVGRSQIASTFRKKMDRKTFALPSDFPVFFESEMKRLGLTCNITGEAKYDNSFTAKVIEVKEGDELLEVYHIDPSRGYICPYIKISGAASVVECKAGNYSLADKTYILFPEEYTYTIQTKLTGKSVSTFKLVKGTLKFNQRISDKEFAVDIPEGVKVFDKRGGEISDNNVGPTGQPAFPIPRSSGRSVIFHAVAPGTLSLATDYANLDKLPWLVREENLKDYVPPPPAGATGWVRWLFMGVGGVMILFALVSMLYKKICKKP